MNVAQTASLNCADIQGNILQGYRYDHARHFALSVGDPHEARELIGSLLPGESANGLEVTTAEEWPKDDKPKVCLNLGVTHAGLRALGAPDEVLKTFPKAFQQGAAERSKVESGSDENGGADDPDSEKGVGLGDVGESAPRHWELGGPGTEEVHLMLSLYTRDRDERTKASDLLLAAFASNGLTKISEHDADALTGGVVHFGYVDGLAQPRVGVGNERRDMQPQAGLGDFLLGAGHTNVYRGNHLGDIPAALGDNATYGAFRILGQDVFGFEDLLTRWARATGMDKERVAAKLMGRWRNGVPVTLSPNTDEPEPPVSDERLNEFDYRPGPGHPNYYDDARGLRCPVGAHIRRLNPRGARVMGIPHSRRIIRRAMPYGPEWKPDQPRNEKPRGLIGYFFCGDLEMQFEFIQRVWANQDLSTNGLRGTREPFVAFQRPDGGSFTIRTTGADDPIILSGLPNLVKTLGSVYCLLPGIGGLRYLANPGNAA